MKISIASIFSRIFFLLGLIIAIFIVGGFFKFAEQAIAAKPPENIAPKDAIVALTGGSAERLKAGIALLERHKGKRLLISGVFKDARPEEVRLVSGGSRALYACCVDLGKVATDTIGNAAEIKEWVKTNHYKSLIIVTDNYHMPRSLLEISNSLDGVELVPYPTKSSPFIDRYWWQDEKAVRGLALEYSKYLAAQIRLKLGIEPKHLRQEK